MDELFLDELFGGAIDEGNVLGDALLEAGPVSTNAFNPDQPRDEIGRFASTDGGGPALPKAKTEEEKQAIREARKAHWAERDRQRYLSDFPQGPAAGQLRGDLR